LGEWKLVNTLYLSFQRDQDSKVSTPARLTQSKRHPRPAVRCRYRDG
jgi:hypothetical protein